MPSPDQINDESVRLDTLRALRILDTAAEERFDRITRLACELFGVPMALVSLVDADRQWFKSKQGIDAQETPRAVSFCAHAIAKRELLEVTDTHEDPRFEKNPLVTGELGLRFYAGCPIRAPNGASLGTLCVLDKVPHTRVTAEERATLQALARMIERELVGIDQTTSDLQTGLTNRAGFLSIGQYVLAHAERRALPVQLLSVRAIHHFAADLAGGSRRFATALSELVSVLADSFRRRDLLARTDTDEFGVLLSCTDEQLAIPLGRLRLRLQQFNARQSLTDRISLRVARTLFSPAQHRNVEDLLSETAARFSGSPQELESLDISFS